jgi:arylsulfatase A-like enzyme
MEELDACLGEILGAIKEAGIYDDSIFIITSDHGGINTSHGGRSLMEMDTPFVIAGKNVKKGGEFSEAMMQYDTAATIAEAFGLKTPQLWRGQSMSQVFE